MSDHETRGGNNLIELIDRMVDGGMSTDAAA